MSERAITAADPGKQERAAAGVPVIPALDGFRAFAICGIVALHLIGISAPPSGGPIAAVFKALPALVDFLFILSGFVVFLPTVAQMGRFGSIGGYAIRRGARLLPAFWLAIAIIALLLAAWPGTPQGDLDVYDYGVHLAGIHTWVHLFDPAMHLGLGIDGPLWTLTLELTFYALLPLIAARYYRHPVIGLCVAAAVTIGWKIAVDHMGFVMSSLGIGLSAQSLLAAKSSALGQFPVYAFHFGLGMSCAWAYVTLKQRRTAGWIERRAGGAQIISLIALIVLAYLFGRQEASSNPVLGLVEARRNILLHLALASSIAAFMLSTSLAARRRQLPFSLPSARSLGDISYGMYLIHLPVLLYLSVLLEGTGFARSLGMFWTLLLVGVPLIVAYGYATARWLEQPIRRWAHRYGRRAAAEPLEPRALPPG